MNLEILGMCGVSPRMENWGARQYKYVSHDLGVVFYKNISKNHYAQHSKTINLKKIVKSVHIIAARQYYLCQQMGMPVFLNSAQC